MLWAVLCGLNEFNKHYVFKLGILDGWAGFMISFGAGEGAFYKHAKAYASKLDDRPPDSPPLHREDGPRSPDDSVVNPGR